MKKKGLVLVTSVVFAGPVIADTAVSSAVTATQSAQIQQLQQEITELQAQVNSTSANGGVGTTHGALSMLYADTTKGAFTDYDLPFGRLPDTGLSYALLQEQQKFPSVLTIGGYFEADAQIWGGDAINNNSTITEGSYANNSSDFAATTADLYFLANLNNWTQAFVTVDGGLTGHTTTVSEAFVTFGNLAKSPFYATLGQSYIPFGLFEGYGVWANTLVTNAFRSAEIPQLNVGFGQGGFNSSIAFFNGEDNVNDFSINAQYGTSTSNTVSATGGLGYVNDVRFMGNELGEAYATGSTPVSNTNPLSGGRNGAIDVNALVNYNFNAKDSLGLSGEWVGTTGSAQVNNVDTGKMSAWDLMGTYTTAIASKSTVFAVGYSATQNMQNVPLALGGAASTGGADITGAKSQWLAYVDSEVLDNVYLGPEYSIMKLYNGDNTWESTLDLSVYF